MILAFLQNAYAGSEEKAIELEQMYDLSDIPDDLRESVATMNQQRRKWGLFSGRNFTGKRLQSIFGQDICRLTWWENASPKWGWKATHSFPADLNHMIGLVNQHHPDVVLTFGKTASDAVARLRKEQLIVPCVHVPGPHPAARVKGVTEQLQEMLIQTLKNVLITDCPHCKKVTYDNSHCHWCYQGMYEEANS